MQARIEYNTKQNRDDRKIKNYFKKVCESQNDIACEIIIELGDMDFWNNKDNEYRLKMVDVYNEQVKALIKIVPNFKVANATIHFDETSPHIHIVGVPIIEKCTRGMKKQVGKSKLFTKTTLTEIQDKMRNACIKSYNKFYEVNIKFFEHSSFEIEKENRSLKYEIEQKDNEIGNLKKELSTKEKIIGKLQTEKEKLKQELQKFKGFWHSIMSHFHKRICYDKDNNYKIVSDDLYKNGIFDDNDNEIANNIYRKVTIPDENKQTKNKKKNNDTRF